MSKILEKAIQIAVNAHFGQTDKAGAPYIFHPLRGMSYVSTSEEWIVAVLHDVVEDTDVTFENLIDAGIPKHLILILRVLTRTKDMDISRLPNITEEDLARLQKYSVSLKFLKSASGNKFQITT
ncbi:(p)ppGpp synthase/HD superfamily hydrolase [Dysgonomonas hofstadii]|uniref:(P)ppGpp synthase/HD superfamily hydrolase n=1 Tax=Dysgonomonas hofstadii TaxID=637886 RepID=A0A840CLA8_9BACT|nr:GTP pyrophosphokinase [Dysgonomonas hofstadii]MBB4035449.1 (p)ppGpp synthase/HD superfamily hydrolase [Dysgonomonas hofstadii]